MKRSVLILHGWPRPVGKDSLYYKYFRDWGYEIIEPEIFSSDFVLTRDNAKKYILDKLEEKSPNVIIGISMGGLLAPHIVQEFPRAKMILIATAPRLKPKAKGFILLIDLAKNKKLLNALNVVKELPEKYLYKFYEAVNPFNGDEKERLVYVKDMKQNFKYILDIPIEKEGEIVDFVTATDNTEILKTLKNKTLIFAGKNDLLMPQTEGDELAKLLSNSRMVVNHGSHFDVIAEPSFIEIEKFLAE
jgi:pimeloyl-ACP methyl ester carboxylesterase